MSVKQQTEFEKEKQFGKKKYLKRLEEEYEAEREIDQFLAKPDLDEYPERKERE